MDKDLEFYSGIEDKVAVISGAASGIGKACAELLSTSGAKVALLDIATDQGNKAAQNINEQGGQALFLNCDVSKERSCKKAIEQVEDHFEIFGFPHVI